VSDLGPYGDWASGRLAGLPRLAAPDVRRRVKALFQVPDVAERPREVREGVSWVSGGVAGLEVSWSVGYGPRTSTWLLRPVGVDRPLPGVLALHGHDGHKFYGKEKIADGPVPVDVAALRDGLYGGRAFASDLARAGFTVLVPDVFGWGSRRFPLSSMPPLLRELTSATRGVVPPDPLSRGVDYNTAAWHHEHLVAKYCAMLGTHLPAVIAAEDRVAASYLRSRSDVVGPVGCVGLSGGGGRAALLTATDDEIAAAVVVAMMSSYQALADRHVLGHSWMLFPPGLSAFADWPDLAACHAPVPLLVQYNREDPLFPLAGQQAAHARIAEHYPDGGYQGSFHDGGHKFDRVMQRVAFSWLGARLAPE